MRLPVERVDLLLFYARFLTLLLALVLFGFFGNFSAVIFTIFFIVSLALTIFGFMNLRNQLLSRLSQFIFTVIDYTISILAVAASGGIVSPFVPYLFMSLATTSAQVSAYFSIVFTSLAGSVLIAQAVIYSPEHFRQSLSTLLPLVISAVYLFSTLSRKPPEEPDQTEDEADSIEDVLWGINDLQRELLRSYNPAEAIGAFLNFLNQSGLPPEILLIQRKLRSIKYFSLKNSEIHHEDATGLVNPELKKLPAALTYRGKKATLTEQTSTLALYLFEEFEDPLEGAAALLASAVFTYCLSDLLLHEESSIYMSQFASLETAVRKIGSSADPRKVIEGAAESVKKLTGIEKVVVVLSSTEEEVSLDPDRTVIKGKVIQHPEEFWRTPLLEAGKMCLKTNQPVKTSSQKGTATIICVPISFENEIMGFISGVSSLPEEEIVSEVNTLEVISRLTAVTLKNIQLIETLDREFISEERRNLALSLFDRLLLNLAEISFRFGFAVKHPETSYTFLHRAKTLLFEVLTEQLWQKASSSTDPESALAPITRLFVNLDIDIEASIDNIQPTRLFYQVVFESLLNATVHGHASRVKIFINGKEDMVVLKITDNGTGFEIRKVMAELKHSEAPSGLKVLFKKMKESGGSLKVASQKGRGTTVTAVFQIPQRGTKVIQESSDS